MYLLLCWPLSCNGPNILLQMYFQIWQVLNASAPDNVQLQRHIWTGLINSLYSCIYVALESNRDLNVFQQPKQISLAVNIRAKFTLLCFLYYQHWHLNIQNFVLSQTHINKIWVVTGMLSFLSQLAYTLFFS